MKKILFLLISVLAISASSFAQNTLVSQYSKVTDTVVNTATKVIGSPAMKLYSRVLTVAINAAKVSGTVAGTASLQGSLDGTYWYTASSTTYTLTDVSQQTFAWTIAEPGSLYYRVAVTGTGTMSAIISGKSFTRKQ